MKRKEWTDRDDYNSEDISFHQKLWIDSERVSKLKRYRKFVDDSFLHSFDFEVDEIPMNSDRDTADHDAPQIADIAMEWVRKWLSHPFTLDAADRTNSGIDEQQIDEQQPIKSDSAKSDSEKSTDSDSTESAEANDFGDSALRLVLANTLRFEGDLEDSLETVNTEEVPSSLNDPELNYFGDGFSEYLRSEVKDYKFAEFQEHEMVVLPLKEKEDISLILSLPVLDRDLIDGDRENKKYERDQKYLKWMVHPHDLPALFEDESNGDSNGILQRQELQLFIPKISGAFSTELKDHHIVASGLNTMWLPLYYGQICLESMDCKSFMDLNEDKVHLEMMTLAQFDGEKRVWAAMRWKYGLRDAALSMNTVNMKRTFWNIFSRKKKSDELIEEPTKTLVFDRPFDFYLYDQRRQIVLASGTISGP